MERLGSIDLGAHFFFQSLRRPWLDPLMAGLTRAGDGRVLLIVAALAALVFVVVRRPWTALAVVLSAALGFTLSESVKRLVDRERPPDAVSPAVPRPSSPSFPSGHALGSMAVFGAIGLGMGRMLPARGPRRLVIGLAFFLAFLIGLTRLYLGVHFLFDVVGGWTAGVAGALFGHWVDRCFAPGPDMPVTERG